MQTRSKSKQTSSVKKYNPGLYMYWPVLPIVILAIVLVYAKMCTKDINTVAEVKTEHVCNEKQLEHAYTLGYQNGYDQR